MKILDTAMTEIVKGNSARYYSKYVVKGKEYIETLNNFKFQNMINPNNEITIGNTCSSGVTFSIYMPTISLEIRRLPYLRVLKLAQKLTILSWGYLQLLSRQVTENTQVMKHTTECIRLTCLTSRTWHFLAQIKLFLMRYVAS